MVLGYVIDVPDIKRDMLERSKLPECAKYSNIYDLNLIDSDFKIRSNKNICGTYDGFIIVSEKFQQFCESEKYFGLEFITLPNALGKSPLYLVGETTKKKLIDAGFNEIFYEKILDKYDWQKN